MNRSKNGAGWEHLKSLFSLAAIGILGQVGCLTTIIIVAALGAGFALDSYLGTRPWFTVGLVLVSIPVTLFLMAKFVLAAAPKLNVDSLTGRSERPPEAPLENEEEQLGDHAGNG